MTPSRPSGSSPKARFEQWCYDVLTSERPAIGPGVQTDTTTVGNFRRVNVRRARYDESPSRSSLHELPPLNPNFYYFGYWYDENRDLHLWHTEEVEHSGKRWARFTNQFVTNQVPTRASASFSILAYSDSGIPSPSAHTAHSPIIMEGENPLSGEPAHVVSGIGGLAYGQFVDIEIKGPFKTFGFFNGWPAGAAAALGLAFPHPQTHIEFLPAVPGYFFVPNDPMSFDPHYPTPLSYPQPQPY